MTELNQDEQRLLTSLSPEEQDLVLRVLEGDEEILSALYQEEYEEVPVSPHKFFTDPYYLGQTGADLYPQILSDLVDVFSTDCVEIVLGGSIGWGKSTFTEFAILRVLYEVACLRNPQRSFGLMEGSSIVLINLSVTHAQAKKAIFTGLLAKVRQSPFFKEKFPYDPSVTSELRFPKNITIFPGASTDNSILGLNVIGGAVDESNFMPVREKAKMPGMRGATVGVYDKADSLYNAMLRRMKSRFMKRGKLPGKLFTLSSAQYPNDFIERKTRQALHDDRIFVRNYSLWEVKPPGEYSDETFKVEVGTDLQGSRILTGKEPPNTIVGKVIDVPIDFIKDFENDIEGSIRDIAGISTLTVDQFIKNFRKVVDCINKKRHHVFTGESTTLEDNHKFYRRTYLKPNPVKPKTRKPVLIHNPEAVRVAHIDPSVSGDATGIAVGHIADMVKVSRKQPDGRKTEEYAPLIFYDLLLQIRPPLHREIQFDRVRDVLYELIKDGMKIQIVTMDSYQSAEPLQQLRRKGLIADLLSVDRTTDPYDILKAAFYENRVDMYEHKIAMQELRQLEHDRQKNKIDHPERGSKDIADAMAGVAFTLTTYASRLYKPTVAVRTFG